jgi:hypothetical protein
MVEFADHCRLLIDRKQKLDRINSSETNNQKLITNSYFFGSVLCLPILVFTLCDIPFALCITAPHSAIARSAFYHLSSGI